MLYVVPLARFQVVLQQNCQVGLRDVLTFATQLTLCQDALELATCYVGLVLDQAQTVEEIPEDNKVGWSRSL